MTSVGQNVNTCHIDTKNYNKIFLWLFIIMEETLHPYYVPREDFQDTNHMAMFPGNVAS